MGKMCCSSGDDDGVDLTGVLIVMFVAVMLFYACVRDPPRRRVVRVYRCYWQVCCSLHLWISMMKNPFMLMSKSTSICICHSRIKDWCFYLHMLLTSVFLLLHSLTFMYNCITIGTMNRSNWFRPIQVRVELDLGDQWPTQSNSIWITG